MDTKTTDRVARRPLKLKPATTDLHAVEEVVISSKRLDLDAPLQDMRSAWEVQSDGSYRQLQPGAEREGRGSQQVLMDLAAQRRQEHARNSARDLFSRGARS